MVHIFVVGSSSVGKTTLITKLFTDGVLSNHTTRRIHEVARTVMRDNNIAGHQLRTDLDLFWKLQSLIIEEQLRQEVTSTNKNHVISDRCFLDAVVYGLVVFTDRFPNDDITDVLLGNSREEITRLKEEEHVMETMFAPFCHESLTMEDMKGAVKRYRSSLVVLVHPRVDQYTTENDGTRFLLDQTDMMRYTNAFSNVLSVLKIPFLDLSQSEIGSRVKIVKEAIDGKQALPFASLEFYEKLSDRKHANEFRKTIESECKSLNLPFYVEPSRRKLSSVRLPLLSVSEYDVQQSWTYLDPGDVNRIVHEYGTRDIHMIQFHPFVKPVTVEAMLKCGISINGETFSMLGCSSSGLKSRKCYLWRGSNLDAEKIRCENGNFNKIKTISKRIARFSLLLSNVKITCVTVEEENTILESDIERNGYNFTDGCGGISLALARRIYKDVYRQEKELTTSDQIERSKYLKLPFKNLGVVINNESMAHTSYQHTSCPSVFQIRYQGFKGVLAIDSGLGNSQNKADEVRPITHVKVRNSMLKFETAKYPFICVCDYSKPYTFGHLNLQYIRLLSSLGVQDETFLLKQEEHFSRVMNMLSNTDDAITILQWNNQFHVAELLLWYRKQLSSEPTQREVDVDLDDVKSFLDGQLKGLQQKLVTQSEKLKILIPKSRNLFGICEPTEGDRKPILKYGQCFVRVAINGKPHTITGQVVVSKNPCYLPGDVRVLKAITCPELEFSDLLVDCLVFPLDGIRAHSAEIAGSDLDGDKYFVCWDKDLIPPKVEEPYEYPAYTAPNIVQKDAVMDNDAKVQCDVEKMIQYMSIQSISSMKVGKIDKLYEKWADRKGVGSNECRRLGQLFSRVIDSAKSGERIVIPNSLKISNENQGPVKFVWQKLKENAHAFKTQFTKGKLNIVEDISEELLLDILCDANSNLREFTKFRLIMNFLENSPDCSRYYCYGVNEEDEIHHPSDNMLFLQFSNSPFAEKINFALFSPSEKGFVMKEYKFPVNFVMNSLTWKSTLLTSEHIFFELAKKYQLDNENIFPWEIYFQWQAGTDCKENNWQELIFRAVNQYSDVLVAMQVPNDVCFILRFQRDPKQKNVLQKQRKQEARSVSISEMDLEGSNISAMCYFYSPRFRYALSYRLYDKDSSFKLDFVDNVLQLYRGEKRRTFIQFKMKESLSTKQNVRKQSKYNKHVENVDSDDEDNHRHSISVDLTRFDSTILTNKKKGRHPLVRKTPVVAVETFVFNRKSNSSVHPVGAAYLDVVSGNQLIDVREDEEDTRIEDEDEDTCLSWSVFEEILGSHSIGKLVATIPIPVEVVISPTDLVDFLEKLSFECKTKYLSGEIQQHLSEMVNRTMLGLTKDMDSFIKVSRLLCGIGLFSVASEAFDILTTLTSSNGENCRITQQDSFNFSSDWKLLVTDYSFFMSFSKRLQEYMNNEEVNWIEPNVAASPGVTQDGYAKIYVCRLMKTEYRLLIEELEENRKRLRTTNSFHNKTSTEESGSIICIDTPETIGNLIIEPAVDDALCKAQNSGDVNEGAMNSGTATAEQKKPDQGRDKEITLYRVTIPPFKMRHWIGQFVVMTKQLRLVTKSNTSAKAENSNKNMKPEENLWTESDFPSLKSSNVEDKNPKNARGKKKPENAEYLSVKDQSADRSNEYQQGSVVCLARVCRLQEAPFSLTIQIIPNTDWFQSGRKAPLYPKCVKQCCSVGESDTNRPCYKWRLSLVQANVVTFSRVMEALKTVASTSSRDAGKENVQRSSEVNESETVDPVLDIEASLSTVTYRKAFHHDILPFIIYPTDIEDNNPGSYYPDLQITNKNLEREINWDSSFMNSLNQSQREALELARNYRITLVHGPPGTGKTTTACAIVYDIMENYGYQKILISAETNLAVDNLALKFIETSQDSPLKRPLNILRLSSRQDRQEPRNPDIQSNPKFQEISLERKLSKRMGDAPRNRSYLSTKEKKEIKEIINEADLVFTTCAGAGDTLLDRHQFEFVLIDEATMTKESTSLCALMHGCKHFVLIGDPNQLGPNNCIVDPDTVDDSPMTLFHKFYERQDVFKTAFLDTQHRMHPALASFPSREFYDSKLKSADGLVAKRSFHRTLGNPNESKHLKWWPLASYTENLTPVCFVDVSDGIERRIGTSYNNANEAYVLSKIWLDLLLAGVVDSYKNIAILTLYKGQVSKLRERFTELLKDLRQLYPLAEVEFPSSLPDFNSVDSYQGRENEVVLVSTVRTGENLGFSGDKNRINVLLTRAKRALCVIGCKRTLMVSPIWAKWIGEVSCVNWNATKSR